MGFGGNLVLAATHALLGVCLSPIFGPVGGMFIAFLVGIKARCSAPNRPAGRGCCPGTAPTGC